MRRNQPPNKARRGANLVWRAMDLHLHTPASSDYQEPKATYLDVLQTAEARGLDIIAFCDHNTVAGLRHLREEIAELELLERLKRLMPEETSRLNEYRRLLDKILLLPGFEFTATFGFHIMGIFPPETTVRELEHLLLSMNVPRDQLDRGAVAVGATTDVITAYRLIAEAGGLAIAAHANSTNGVAMRGFGFGGQTKIAFTQDMNLCALEVTDLDQKGRRSTAAFFSGTKPEYPRRMHCITGSDAHRLTRDPSNSKNLGIGDRATDVLLDEVNFESLKALFSGSDFARVRPHVPGGSPSQPEFDHVQQAREEGANLVQAFHDSMQQRGGKLYTVISDVCAFANTNGGTVYIGVSADPKQAPVGVPEHEQAVRELRSSIARMLTPPIACSVDLQDSQGKKIIRVLVPRGDDPPYAIEDNKIYVREEAETSLAVRDEIVQLVLRGKAAARAVTAPAAVAAAPAEAAVTATEPAPVAVVAVEAPRPAAVGLGLAQAQPPASPPKTGVEIMATEERDGTRYHTMRDLRNGSVVKNVTRTSARKLWHYAITAREAGPLNPNLVTWQGDIGLWRKTHKGGQTRYDLVQRSAGELRVFYGVTEDGIHGPWRKLVEQDERLQPPQAPLLLGAAGSELGVLPSTADTTITSVEAAPAGMQAVSETEAEPPAEVVSLLAEAAEAFDLPVPGGAEDVSAPLIDLEAAAADETAPEPEHASVDEAVAPAEPETNGAGRPARKSRGGRGSRGSGSSKKATKTRAAPAGKTAAKSARKQAGAAAKTPSRSRTRRPKAAPDGGE